MCSDGGIEQPWPQSLVPLRYPRVEVDRRHDTEHDELPLCAAGTFSASPLNSAGVNAGLGVGPMIRRLLR